MNYYNEFDPGAAAWLRELIARGHIAPGVVDDRSIEDVEAADLAGFRQCHFFAGIGGWSLALRLAGWPDERPVWTGSPPCQPFSAAGRLGGYDDERHLAPKWLDLVSKCRPTVVFGEQVASAFTNAKHPWVDDLQDVLEAEGYAVGKIVLPACSVGAPHIRQRGWFVAERVGDTDSSRAEARLPEQAQREEGIAEVHDNGSRGLLRSEPGRSAVGGVADSQSNRLEGCRSANTGRGETGARPRGERYDDFCYSRRPSSQIATRWNNPDWLLCRDGKWRPVESGTFPLAHGVSARVGRLRGYGNAIVPQVATEVIRAFMDITD